jgi:hypothetical protein
LPLFIQPDAPFEDMKWIAHEVQPHLWAKVVFSGDVFEMEDQRNWIDASFKTFCTPLRLPYPVQIEQGTKVSQSVTLRLEGHDADCRDIHRSTATTALQFTIDQTELRTIPPLGLGMPVTTKHDRTRVAAFARPCICRICALICRYRTRVLTYLQRASNEARALGATLEAALFLTDNAAAELDDCFALARVEAARWFMVDFSYSRKVDKRSLGGAARERLQSFDATVPVGAGTNAYFTELNRQRHRFEYLISSATR